MANKIVIIALILGVFPCMLSSQVYYDAADNTPVFKLFKDKQDSLRVEYYLSQDSSKILDTDIQFNYGTKGLFQYFDSLYFKSFTEENYREVNRWESYSILFDDKLRIKDIRIIARPGQKEYDASYDALIKRILLSTEGMWHKTNVSNNWSFYLGLVHIK